MGSFNGMHALPPAVWWYGGILGHTGEDSASERAHAAVSYAGVPCSIYLLLRLCLGVFLRHYCSKKVIISSLRERLNAFSISVYCIE